MTDSLLDFFCDMKEGVINEPYTMSFIVGGSGLLTLICYSAGGSSC